MEKALFTKALQALKDSSKRNFDQSYEIIINLKNLDLKNQNNHIDMYLTLPKSHGRKVNICALVGRELKEGADASFDKVITNEDFAGFDGKKKETKKLANSFDYFVAQATLMPQVAKTFGRVFGPRQKMPNPKAGCVVPPNANLKPLADKLKRTVRVQAKKMPVIQCIVGKESLSDDEVVENMFAAYSQVMHALPQESNNIKAVFVKKTMSKAIEVGAKQQAPTPEPKKKEKPATEAKKEAQKEAGEAQ